MDDLSFLGQQKNYECMLHMSGCGCEFQIFEDNRTKHLCQSFFFVVHKIAKRAKSTKNYAVLFIVIKKWGKVWPLNMLGLNFFHL